jgi:sugar O-acyltransferase (sialic acid O-acetyltransferase NeuD family)
MTRLRELQPVAVIGAGGFAREVVDVIEAANADTPRFDILGYIVDPQYGQAGTMINDRPILGGLDWLTGHASDVQVTCAVGAPHLRRRLVERVRAVGGRFFSIIHPAARLTRWVEVGEGVVVTAGCILTNQIRLGDHVHLNLDCTVGHDAVLDEFATTAPGVHVSGNVHLETGAYVGTGANIIEKVTVGRWSVVGAGSAVIKDVPPNATAVGIPARVVKERPEGWYLES